MKAEETQARDDGGPAFPVPCSAGPLGAITWGEGGMSLRDYFAAKAMAAILTDPEAWSGIAPIKISESAYRQADAMLAARKK